MPPLAPLLALLLACDTEEADVFTGEDLEGELQGYEEWAHPEAWPAVEVSCAGSHGAFAEIWVNGVAADDLAAGDLAAGAFSEGAILVEEGYQDEGETFKSLVVMRKVPGFDPDAGDWFWASYDEDGAEVVSGRVGACSSCHAAGTDFVRHPSADRAAVPSECPVTL